MIATVLHADPKTPKILAFFLFYSCLSGSPQDMPSVIPNGNFVCLNSYRKGPQALTCEHFGDADLPVSPHQCLSLSKMSWFWDFWNYRYITHNFNTLCAMPIYYRLQSLSPNHGMANFLDDLVDFYLEKHPHLLRPVSSSEMWCSPPQREGMRA